MNRWRYARWRDLVSACATVTLDLLERPPASERATSRLRQARRPAGADDLAAEFCPIAGRVRRARLTARPGAKPAAPTVM